METEVKLGFNDKESLFKVAKTDSFLKFCKNPDVLPVLLENTYLDTEDLQITKRGGAVRIRHYSGNGEDSYEFTVKYGGGTSQGLHRRYEWNVKSDNDKFSIDNFKSGASGDKDPSDILNEVFSGLKDDDLKVVCFNSFYRTIYELSYGTSLIEACFDSGLIRNSDGTKTDEICELELEIAYGNIGDLEALTAILIKDADCEPLDKTKYSRTLNMALGDRK